MAQRIEQKLYLKLIDHQKETQWVNLHKYSKALLSLTSVTVSLFKLHRGWWHEQKPGLVLR